MKRRNFFKKVLGLSSIGLLTPTMADYWNVDWSIERPNDFPIEEALFEITQGKKVQPSYKIKLGVPKIAENGAVVPVRISVNSPMTKENHVKGIYILTKQGNSRVIYVTLTPANGKAQFATRIKMKESGNVFAIVQFSNGDFIGAVSKVKVTIGGGCC
jgi:sulfur-oxidizing protein SoxY